MQQVICSLYILYHEKYQFAQAIARSPELEGRAPATYGGLPSELVESDEDVLEVYRGITLQELPHIINTMSVPVDS